MARLTRDHQENRAELAMIVGDRFQRQGLGTELRRRLVAVAQAEGIAAIEAHMLPTNTAMAKICSRLGFQVPTNASPDLRTAVLTLT